MVTYDDCLACRECCTFDPEDRYFAPVFTRAEMRRVQKSGAHVEFRQKEGSHNVYQPTLVVSRRDGDMLVCPLLDEETHRCTVYDLRPMDCRLWPYLLVKSPVAGTVDLYCFNESECPSLRRQGRAQREEVRQQVRAFACSDECRDMLRDHPGLVWDPEPDTFLVDRIPLG